MRSRSLADLPELRVYNYPWQLARPAVEVEQRRHQEALVSQAKPDIACRRGAKRRGDDW